MALTKLSDPPPYFYLKQIHMHCPMAAETYDYLWEMRDKDNRLILEKKDIPNQTLKAKTTFLSHLRMLCREQLIDFNEDERCICIEMVDWHEEE